LRNFRVADARKEATRQELKNMNQQTYRGHEILSQRLLLLIHSSQGLGGQDYKRTTALIKRKQVSRHKLWISPNDILSNPNSHVKNVTKQPSEQRNKAAIGSMLYSPISTGSIQPMNPNYAVLGRLRYYQQEPSPPLLGDFRPEKRKRTRHSEQQ
jgi:hypothetical protein